MVEPPWGFDIIVLAIIEELPEPWLILAEAVEVIYARIMQAHGSPPDMTTICRNLDWWYDEDHPGDVILTWDADDTVPAETVIAVIRRKGVS